MSRTRKRSLVVEVRLAIFRTSFTLGELDMRSFPFVLASSFLCLAIFSQTVSAQNVRNESAPEESGESYHYRTNDVKERNPKDAVRAKAEFRAQQRMNRIASENWYGYSPARPITSASPWSSAVYSPAWNASWSKPYPWESFALQPLGYYRDYNGAVVVRRR